MSFLWTLEGLRSPALTAFFTFITMLGEETILVVLLCVLYWCYNKDLAYGVGIVFFLSTLLIQGLKILVRIERPWLLDPAFMPVEAALATATGYSFPSGHTQSAAAIFGTLGLATRKKGWIAVGWGITLLVGLSRMYLGVHTPLDVGVSLLLVLVLAIAVLAFLRRGGSDLVLAGVLAALSLLVLGYALALYSQGIIETHNLADCFKAGGGCIGCAVAFLWVRRGTPFRTETPRLWQQAVKLLLGLGVLLALKSGLKALWGSTPLLDALRYFLIALWALAVYPKLFTRALQDGGEAQ